MCLEVKSSGSESFNLSAGEWAEAERYHDAGHTDLCAVLVVRRAADGGPPSRLDLLVDPVELVRTEQLRQDIDGYRIAYRTS
jgi:hypothetical protein